MTITLEATQAMINIAGIATIAIISALLIIGAVMLWHHLAQKLLAITEKDLLNSNSHAFYCYLKVRYQVWRKTLDVKTPSQCLRWVISNAEPYELETLKHEIDAVLKEKAGKQ